MVNKKEKPKQTPEVDKKIRQVIIIFLFCFYFIVVGTQISYDCVFKSK